METNQITITPEITIPKGNFDFLMEATHNEQLYLGCLNAEKCMMTDYDACLKNIRRTIEMLGIELEKWSRAEQQGISPDEALRSIFIDLKRAKSHKGSYKERRRISKKNFYIRHVVDFEKKDHEEYTRKQIAAFTEDYANVYPTAVNDGKKKNKSFRDIAYDIYARCSKPLTDKGSATKEDCANLIRLFHGMLCLLNYVQEPYDPELTPMDDYFPVPYEYYDELNLIKGVNSKIYVSPDGNTFYMLKRKDIDYMDILNPDIYRERMRELSMLDTFWGRLGGIIGYGEHPVLEVGTHDYRRAVYKFAGRPQAMTKRFIEGLDKKSMREELSRGLIRLIRIMHEPVPSIPHGHLNPECIYVCEGSRGLLPYIVGFEDVKPDPVRGDFPDRNMLDDYFNLIDMQKFTAPEIRNLSPGDEVDLKSADIYSLGKLIKYIYGRDEIKVRDYVDELIVKDPEARPGIVEASRMYDDEVVYFEPTVKMGDDVLTEFRLLIYSAYHGFEDHRINDTVTIGRMFSSSGKDIKVDSPIASRTHGRFVKTDSGFEYIDMLSTNGTFINGVLYGAQRAGHPEPKKLKIGDILKIDHPEFLKAHRNAILMFVLGPSEHRMKERTIDITEGMVVSVGREPTDVTLANNRVSKRHARFVVKDGVLYIQDLNSTNGVYVNGNKIESAEPLNAMDCIRIVDYVFIVTGDKIRYFAE